MTEYLQMQFELEDDDFVATIDELSLWSAPFGLMLLDRIKLAYDMKVLDIGCGAGFPLFEVAQRLGASSVVYGLDLWQAALRRARQKIQNYQVTNVRLITGDALAAPFRDNSFDLITSNLGINYFEHPLQVFHECFRMLKPNGQIALTTNVKGHTQEFYEVFHQTLLDLHLTAYVESLQAHINHRLEAATVVSLLEEIGFRIAQTHTDSFWMRFLDGSAFLRHYFIRLGFLEDWKRIIPAQQQHFFQQLETNLNHYATKHGELRLTVPCVYIGGVK